MSETQPAQTGPQLSVVITDIDVPFWSLVTVLLKGAFAAIPALLVFGAVIGGLMVAVGLVFAVLSFPSPLK